MKLSRLTQEQRFPRPLEEIFPFFSRAENLGSITPPWLRFSIRSGQDQPMAEGLELVYRIRLLGIPLRWKSEIQRWDPPHAFVDQQLEGPYELWHHEHRFFDEGTSCLVRDVVNYRVPGGEIPDRLFIRPQLNAIFRYRQKELVQRFGGDGGAGPTIESIDGSDFDYSSTVGK